MLIFLYVLYVCYVWKWNILCQSWMPNIQEVPLHNHSDVCKSSNGPCVWPAFISQSHMWSKGKLRGGCLIGFGKRWEIFSFHNDCWAHKTTVTFPLRMLGIIFKACTVKGPFPFYFSIKKANCTERVSKYVCEKPSVEAAIFWPVKDFQGNKAAPIQI